MRHREKVPSSRNAHRGRGVHEQEGTRWKRERGAAQTQGQGLGGHSVDVGCNSRVTGS